MKRFYSRARYNPNYVWKNRNMTAPPTIKLNQSSALAQTSLQEGEDYYLDGPHMVFTAAYHLRRGSCCNSDCRHCPYRETDRKK